MITLISVTYRKDNTLKTSLTVMRVKMSTLSTIISRIDIVNTVTKLPPILTVS